MTGKPEPKELIEKVNVLTRSAKASWFGLISYLAFVGVTLMGVKDADFFIVENETALPLIGVTIPTILFFYVGPILGAALFAYFHLHLMKLWEALGDIVHKTELTPASDHVAPWLLSDFALSYHAKGLRKRPANWLVKIVSLLLTFWATPIVLFFFWWRSLPAHDLLLTLGFCGISFLTTIILGLVSWQRLRDLIRSNDDRVATHRRSQILVNVLSGAIVGLLSLFQTTMPASEFVDKPIRAILGYFSPVYLAKIDQAENDDARGNHHPISDGFWHDIPFSLYPAQLQNVDFSYTSKDWLSYDKAKIAYKPKFCSEHGIPNSICTYSMVSNTVLKPKDKILRERYCRDQYGADIDCDEIFDQINKEFEIAWQEKWSLELSQLVSRDLANRDFREANLNGAKLQRVNLWNAELQGADVRFAELQGTHLFGAKLQGANLAFARLQGASVMYAELQGADLRSAELQRANLSNAELQGADLEYAKLQGAFLWAAELQGAVLGQADLQGANLAFARLQGAALFGAELDKNTYLIAAILSGAAVRSVDYTNIPQISEHLNGMFGDASVTLPGGGGPDSEGWPAHWPKFELDDHEFKAQWKKWLDNPEGYVPPDPPADDAE